MTLETGIRGEQSVLVTAANTAKTMGSGTLEVFATPALVALAEKTCWMSVADALGEGNGSVGTKLELEHTAPTPVGMTVTCESELVAVEGRKLTFKVSPARRKRPCRRRHPRALCGERRQVRRQGRGEEGVKLLPSSLRDATVPLFVAYTTSSPGRGKSFSMREALAVR